MGLTKRREADEEPAREIALHARKAGHVYDTFNGKYLGEKSSWPVNIEQADVRLFSVLPYKVRGLRIECDQKAKRGKAITGEVVVDTGGATPVRHVIHLQVTRPDGKAVRDLAQNLETANGAARFSIPIALNGPEGEWALRFADVATQVKSSVELNVQ